MINLFAKLMASLVEIQIFGSTWTNREVPLGLKDDALQGGRVKFHSWFSPEAVYKIPNSMKITHFQDFRRRTSSNSQSDGSDDEMQPGSPTAARDSVREGRLRKTSESKLSRDASPTSTKKVVKGLDMSFEFNAAVEASLYESLLKYIGPDKPETVPREGHETSDFVYRAQHAQLMSDKLVKYKAGMLALNGLAGCKPHFTQSNFVERVGAYGANLIVLFAHDDLVDKTDSPFFQDRQSLTEYNQIIRDTFPGTKGPMHKNFDRDVVPRLLALIEKMEKESGSEIQDKFKMQMFAVAKGFLAFSQELEGLNHEAFGASSKEAREHIDRTFFQYLESTEQICERRFSRDFPTEDEYPELREFTSAVDYVLEVQLALSGHTLTSDERDMVCMKKLRHQVNLIVCEINDSWSNYKDGESEESSDKAQFSMDSLLRIRLFSHEMDLLLGEDAARMEELATNIFKGLDGMGFETSKEAFSACFRDEGARSAAYIKATKDFSSRVSDVSSSFELGIDSVLRDLGDLDDLTMDELDSFEALDLPGFPNIVVTQTVGEYKARLKVYEANLKQLEDNLKTFREIVIKDVCAKMAKASPETIQGLAEDVVTHIKHRVTTFQTEIGKNFAFSRGDIVYKHDYEGHRKGDPVSPGMAVMIKSLYGWQQCFYWHEASGRYAFTAK